MKKFVSFVCFLFVFLISISCTGDRFNPKGASLVYSEAKPLETNFLFSTVEGKMLIMADCEAAQNFNDEMVRQNKFSMFDLGVGNAFVIDSAGVHHLYTAKHCARGLEEITRVIGSDIAIIDYDRLQSIHPSPFELTKGYDIDYAVYNNDSVFVRGYLTNQNGMVQSVTLSGVGLLLNKRLLESHVKKGCEYLQENVLLILMKENIDLAGLSGSPAFNKKGKVIGVYSGRMYDQETHDMYARVSLFR